MRRLIMLVGVVAIPCTAALADLDAYPTTTLAEEATATWCQYCPYAYAGLEVAHSVYDYSEFVSARYYASSGSYGTAETDAAIAYYNIPGYPTVIFNGTEQVVGGSEAIAAGGRYIEAIASAYFAPAPIRVEVDTLDVQSGYIKATITMYSPDTELDNAHLRFLLVEDNVSGNHTHVTRDIINDTISLSGQGSTTTVEQTFDIAPGWDASELYAVVFVQETDRRVLQAFSTHPTPDYKVRAIVPFAMTQIGPSSGTYEGEFFSVVNVGMADDYTVNMVMDEAPAGWTAGYYDDQGTEYTGESSFSLGTEEYVDLRVGVVAASPGMMNYHFEVASANLDSVLVVPFTYITDDIDALLVDDDGGESFEDYFMAALDSAGRSYGLWNLAAAKLSEDVAQTFSVLIWNVGWSFPSLDQTDRGFLRDYLDSGRHLFLSGQDVGWDLNDASSGNTDLTFYHDYLHARYIRDDTNIYYLDGVPGDPVSDDLTLHIAGGDGANNQEYPSQIEAYDEEATEIFYYQGDGDGAIRSRDSSSGAKIVYLGFGFEAIDNAADRAALMGAAVNWLRAITDSDAPSVAPSAFELQQNHPNPFVGATTIEYSLPQAGKVDLAVYNAQGQRVRTLLRESQEGGRVSLRWDGSDDCRQRLASGIYFYKLKVDGQTEETRRCLLVR